MDAKVQFKADNYIVVSDIDWQQEIEMALMDFAEVCRLASIPLERHDIKALYYPSPHNPIGLPKNTMAVYGFNYEGKWLKIGIAGKNSNARFQSQHYLPSSSRSNLAQSLLRDGDMKSIVKEQEIGDWIKTRCHRISILLNSNLNKSVLRLLEAFLHARLHPRYEG